MKKKEQGVLAVCTLAYRRLRGMRHLSVVRRSQTQQHCFNCPFQLAKLPDDERLKEAFEDAISEETEEASLLSSEGRFPLTSRVAGIESQLISKEERLKRSSFPNSFGQDLEQTNLSSTPLSEATCETASSCVSANRSESVSEEKPCDKKEFPTSFPDEAESLRSALSASVGASSRSFVVGLESLIIGDWTTGRPRHSHDDSKTSSFSSGITKSWRRPTVTQLEAFVRSRSCLCQDSPEAAALYSMRIEEGDLIVCATDGAFPPLS